ncbi:MAG: hypothetical protein A3E83_09340 [Gammaproteobacteria bacterium RIFCSPHIGHO2_12_FULL_41_20]|nr:MAG: hypothetical protein A3E83_09340 [Gammaproteobacteria bacterium RIFCSPHIGHO2_12_FULL_41_20]
MPNSINVDFYILEKSTKPQSRLFICRLLEKAYQQQQLVYIHVDSPAEAEQLDTLLWTYREDSFIPHNIYSSPQPMEPSIQIGYTEKPPHHQEILINLCHEIPIFYAQFTHIIEIVFADPNVQQLARERFRQYRSQQCVMNTHKV